MNFKRIGRALICLILVCVLLVQISPVQAEASAIVAGLTVAEVLGYLTLIIGTTAGAVYMVNNREEVAAIGQSISIGNEPGDEDALNHVLNLTENIKGMWDAGGDGSGFDPRLGTKIAQGLLAIIGGTLVTAIASGNLEGKSEIEEEASDGYMYYNGHLFPSVPTSDTYPYELIFYNSEISTFYFVRSKSPFACPGSDSSTYGPGDVSRVYSLTSGTWTYVNNPNGNYTRYSFENDPIVWSNHDVLNVYNNEEIYFLGSEPTKTYTSSATVSISPEIYVGDLPSQIENGDLDEDESKKRILAPLPDYIDITKILKSTETAVEDLRQWQQQVADGQKSLEQAIKDITGDIKVDDPVEDIEPEPETSLLSQILTAIKEIPTKIIDKLRDFVKSLFTPSDGYLESKVEGLTSKYDFAKSIADTSLEMKKYLLNLGQQPPIIYIDLGAASGSYTLGGKVAFVDLTWYAQYKGTMDVIISAFLWLWFVWRMTLALPGIIQGTSGFWTKDYVDAGLHTWRDDGLKIGAGDGTIYANASPVPPGRRLGWGKTRGFKEVDKRK